MSSEAARVPTKYWEQMLPKKLPTPSSAPSKGTNSVASSSFKTVKVDGNLLAKGGKV